MKVLNKNAYIKHLLEKIWIILISGGPTESSKKYWSVLKEIIGENVHTVTSPDSNPIIFRDVNDKIIKEIHWK